MFNWLLSLIGIELFSYMLVNISSFMIQLKNDLIDHSTSPKVWRATIKH